MFKRIRLPLVLCAIALFVIGCGSSEPIEVIVEVPIEAVEEVEVEKVVEVEREVEVQVVKEVTVEMSMVVEAEEAADMAGDAAMEVAALPPAPRIIPEEPNEQPDTMIFEDERENRFVDTRDDHLSTFAIDVDTGAYTLMRNYLFDYGALPNPDSVRVEEYVNFFDQQYPAPAEGAFAIYHEAAPAPYGESENYHLLRVGIKGYEVPADQRPPVLLIFVIDVSGSMDGPDRIGLVRESLKLLVNALNENDRVGIVTYGSSARTVLSPTAIGDDKREITRAIDNLNIEGATNADAGIEMAYTLADKYRLSDETARLIVLSDGVANVGRTTAETILDHAKRDVSLSTFGFGMGSYNDTMMEQLANDGDGTYAYIDTLREAERVFVDDMTGTLLTIAKDAKIQVEFNADVVALYRLLGYENRDVADNDFRNDTVDAGEIGAGHSVTALYEVRLLDDVPADATLLTTRVRYEEPDSNQVIEMAESFQRGDITADYASTSSTFQLSAVAAEYAELLRGSFWAEANSLGDLWQDAYALGRLFPGNDQVDEFLDLVEQAAQYEQ